MSFNFEWPTFSEAYYADAREILEQVSKVSSRIGARTTRTRGGSSGACVGGAARKAGVRGKRGGRGESQQLMSSDPIQALNKGTKPAIIADRIEVKELHMGTLVRHFYCPTSAHR